MLSVICPTFNEKDYIKTLIESVLEMQPKNKELIIIDGLSDDGTREILQQFHYDGKIILYDNPNRTVPFALNIGIKNAKGSIISRIDAHTKYADDYFLRILETFEEIDADIVGGPTRVSFNCEAQKAIGKAISNQFGIGDSLVHQIEYQGYTDSVTFGAWKKEIFEKTDFFDESLKRNQDDEFHYRARSLGFKIYQNPKIKLWYYPRSSILALFKQYYQYGFYKPLVLLKIGSEAKLRHLIPSFFVIYLAALLPFIFISLYAIIPLTLYLLVDFIITAREKELNNSTKLILFLSFPAIHISYGLGFILGLINRLNK